MYHLGRSWPARLSDVRALNPHHVVTREGDPLSTFKMHVPKIKASTERGDALHHTRPARRPSRTVDNRLSHKVVNANLSGCAAEQSRSRHSAPFVALVPMVPG